jgi:hypothetical protein
MVFWILDFGFWILRLRSVQVLDFGLGRPLCAWIPQQQFQIQNAVAGFVYPKNTRNSPLNSERSRPTPPAVIDYRGRMVKKY